MRSNKPKIRLFQWTNQSLCLLLLLMSWAGAQTDSAALTSASIPDSAQLFSSMKLAGHFRESNALVGQPLHLVVGLKSEYYDGDPVYLLPDLSSLTSKYQLDSVHTSRSKFYQDGKRWTEMEYIFLLRPQKPGLMEITDVKFQVRTPVGTTELVLEQLSIEVIEEQVSDKRWLQPLIGGIFGIIFILYLLRFAKERKSRVLGSMKAEQELTEKLELLQQNIKGNAMEWSLEVERLFQQFAPEQKEILEELKEAEFSRGIQDVFRRKQILEVLKRQIEKRGMINDT